MLCVYRFSCRITLVFGLLRCVEIYLLLSFFFIADNVVLMLMNRKKSSKINEKCVDVLELLDLMS